MAEKVFTSCTNSGPVSVYVKDGKVVRIRPLVVDENDYKPWVIEAGGRKFSPPKKVTLSPYVHAERRRLYSDERIKYPMKRVDFDPTAPDGEAATRRTAASRATSASPGTRPPPSWPASSCGSRTPTAARPSAA